MNTATTLSGFLKQTGAEARVFDMGRRVVTVPARQFQSLERAELPYPLPLQQQAWFGLMFWRPQTREEPHVWFLRLPLDERGLLVPAARDAFLYQFLQMVETQLNQGAGKTPGEDLLAGSPYTFQPREERLAVFHAKTARTLRRPASRFYEQARSYCAGELGYENWTGVGLQGLADIAARWDRDGNERLLEQALLQLPARPFGILCSCLENEAVSSGVTRILAHRVATELAGAAPDDEVIASAVRGMSYSTATAMRRHQLSGVLESAGGTRPRVLAAISSRSWQDLEADTLRHLFLERLAENREGQDFFNATMADLLYLPGMREHFFKDFREPARSERLSRAIGRLFSAYSSH